jgi:4-amino-4-deoxy-L-arabinose transferase-like glycosyltransferase
MFSKLQRIYLNHQKVIHILIFTLIILISGFVRVYDLQNNPIGLNQDEAVNGYDAYSIGLTGKDHHGAIQPQPFLQSFDDWSSPLITYITIPFVKVFGLNEFAIRLPVAILGILSIFLFYILVNQLFKNKNIALLGSLIWAFSPWYISLSRWAVPPSIVPFFLLLFLISLFWALDSFNDLKRKRLLTAVKFILAGITAGVLVYSYPTMKVFVPIFIGLICMVYLIWDRKKFLSLFLMGFVTLLTISPIFYLTFTDPAKYNARFSETALGGSGLNLVLGFILRYLEYFSPSFAFGFGDQDIMHHVPNFSSMPEILAPFFYIGLAVVVYRLVKFKQSYLIEKKYLLILLIGLFTFPVAASLTKDHLMLLRALHGFVFMAIFILIGIKFTLDSFSNYKAKYLTLATMIVLIVFNLGAFSFYYFGYYPDSVKKDFNYGLKQTFEYIQENEDNYDKIIIDKDIFEIYYLFYSRYDPNLLHSKSVGEKFGSYNEGKIVFVEKGQFSDGCDCSKRMFSIKDEKQTWYEGYEDRELRILAIKKRN